MFDAWSLRKNHAHWENCFVYLYRICAATERDLTMEVFDLGICADEFLALSVPWLLSTDSYLQLTGDLRIQDELAATLWSLPDEESQRHLDSLLSAPSISGEVLSSLFIWTVEQISTKVWREEETQDMESTLKGCSKLVETWEGVLKRHERCRDVFWSCLPQLITRLLARHSYGSKNDPVAKADEIIEGFVSEVITQLQQGIGSSVVESPEHAIALQQWFKYLKRTTSSLQEDISRPTKKLRIDSTVSRSQQERLQKRLSQDRLHLTMEGQQSSHRYTQGPTVYDTHQRAFIKICETIQKTQDYPGCPPRDLLIISRTPAFTSTGESALKDHCDWVESIINSRATGWQSSVKLKLQFYAVFEES